jgi:CRP/FNR family transcriptional regulator, anaerobic regulatory protein
MSPHLPEQCSHCSMYFDTENFCAKLSDNELIALNAQSSLVTVKRDEAVPEETQKRHPVMAISSGVLSLQHLLHDGRKTIAAILMRGDILDLRNSTQNQLGALIALNSVTLCRLSPVIFDAAIAENPKARMLAWANITDQTFRAINHAADLAKKQALEKLASFIFEIRNRDTHVPGHDHVQIPIRRRDLAEYLGMQPETVSRCFKDLAKRGIIHVSDLSVIRILNAPALRRISNGDRSPKGGRLDDPSFNVLVADA